MPTSVIGGLSRSRAFVPHSARRSMLGRAWSPIWAAGSGRGEPPTTISRCVKSSLLPATEAKGLAGASLVVHVLGKKGGCASEANVNTPGSLELPSAFIRPVALPRSPLDETSPEPSRSRRRGPAIFCFAHKLPYGRTPFLAPVWFTAQAQKARRAFAR